MASIKRISGLEINVVVNEIQQQLIGLRVTNVYSINKRTYMIKLSGTNAHFPATTKQYLIIESGVRLHITSFEREIESTPNGLATAIRRQLKGKILSAIEQKSGGLDRVVRLGFGLAGSATSFNIFVELFGTGNIVLADYQNQILALLRQQTYGAALLGSNNANPLEDAGLSTPTTPVVSTPSDPNNSSTVALRSKYQWDSPTQSPAFPPLLNHDFILTLFKNKHQRLLEQEQQQLEQSTTPQVASGKAKTPRKKDKSSQTTVKQVLYESILGPQLCLHGCSQLLDLDINQLYTTVFTNADYLDKLVKALQLGLEHYYTIIKECCGYLHCRLTTTTTDNYDQNEQLIGSKIDNVLVTMDFSPGNLAQTTISPTVYIPPVTSTPGATLPSEQSNGPSSQSAIINDGKGVDQALPVLMTTTCCSNKISPTEAQSLDKSGKVITTPLFQTFELPANGYQTFDWGIVTPTSKSSSVAQAQEEKVEKKKKNLQAIQSPIPQGTVKTTIVIKDVWFYTATFSSCVDIYYGTKEVEKEISRMEREKINVLSRIEKTKLEQRSKLQTLQDNIDTMLLKAQLIENNQSWVQQSINAVQQQIQRGHDWIHIADVIKQQKTLLNPLALLIDKIEFTSHSMIVSLSWELEHLQILIQNELIKRNAELAKKQQEHIIRPVPSRSNQSNAASDDDDSDEDDEEDEDEEDDDDEEDEDDQDDTIIVDEVEDEESLQDAKDNKAEENARQNAPGSWKKPVKITIDWTQTAYTNAQVYYTHVKELTRKKQVAEQFSEQTIKSVEKKGQKELHHVKEIQAKQRRKVMWFEKFYWFISSENFLVVGGRDATQNELLVKRYLDTNDLYFHADVHGASSVVVKVPHSYVASYQQQFGANKPIVLPQMTLAEAAGFTTCHSNAWMNKSNNTRAYWVYASQVSKTPPTGMYLEKGSFMIRGQKNYLEPQPLQMGLGLIFRCGDDDSILRHQNERQVRSLAGADMTGDDATKRSTTNVFQQEQNKKQQLQEEHLARLEEEQKQKQLQKLQHKQLKMQQSASASTPTEQLGVNTLEGQASSNNVAVKRILSKSDRYQMKKLGLTDPIAYWAWKDAQSITTTTTTTASSNTTTATKNEENTKGDDESEVDCDAIVPGEDVDEDGQVPEWLKKSKEMLGGSDDEEDEDAEVINDEEDDDEDDDRDSNGAVPDWLKKAKEQMGGSDLEDEDEEVNYDDQDEDDDRDSHGMVPEWLKKAKAQMGGSDLEDEDEDDEDEAPALPTKSSQKNATTTPAAAANTKNDKNANNNAKRGKQGKGKKNTGFDSDDDDDEGVFDPLKFLPKSKKHLLTALAVSSDDDTKHKPQHGVNKKKGNTKQARLERQEAAKAVAEEAKKLKQKQAEERERAHKAKMQAKQQSKKDTRQALKANANENGENVEGKNANPEDDNEFVDDDDEEDGEYNELSLRRLQQQRLEMEGTDYVLSTLTANPDIADYLTHAIPVVAPYAALLDYQYKVKLVPGGGKKGQTIKDCSHVILQNIQAMYKHPPLSSQISTKNKANQPQVTPLDQLSEEEQKAIQKEKTFQTLLSSLIRQIGDNEFSLAMMSNAKVSVQGIQQVHKQQKIQKKQVAKQKDKSK